MSLNAELVDGVFTADLPCDEEHLEQVVITSGSTCENPPEMASEPQILPDVSISLPQSTTESQSSVVPLPPLVPAGSAGDFRAHQFLPNCKIIYPVKRFSLNPVGNKGVLRVDETLKYPMPRLHQPTTPLLKKPTPASSGKPFTPNDYVILAVPPLPTALPEQEQPSGQIFEIAGQPKWSKPVPQTKAGASPSMCSVALCNNYRGKKGCEAVMFHRFPLDPIYRTIWIARCRRQKHSSYTPWTPDTTCAAVCSLHFAADAYRQNTDTGSPMRRNMLRHDAVPTLFGCLPEHLRPKIGSARPPPKERLPLETVARVRKRSRYIVGTQTDTQGSDIVQLVEDMEQMQTDLDGAKETETFLRRQIDKLKGELEASNMETVRLRGVIQKKDLEAESAREYVMARQARIQTALEKTKFRAEKFRDNDFLVRHLTGYKTYSLMESVYQDFANHFNLETMLADERRTKARDRPYRAYSKPALTYFSQFFLTLIKLRRDLSVEILGAMFDINPTTVRRYYYAWTRIMNESLIIPPETPVF